ncbi:hypothetical protein ACFYOF_20595 [Streptomyces sp. NPDC007148]|uniref:hypothetical protein n=1 Tax=Streptomyces sp. NPDC007148 TaxID=3364775 RepID=UPI0036BA01B7
MNSLHRIAPGWPALPGPETFIPDDRQLPSEQWPPLTLTWWDIPPTVLEADRLRGDITDSLLHAEGAPAPLAIVSLSPVPTARYGRGWLWRCQVHVVGADCDSAAQLNHDCTRFSRSTTRDGARDAARAHIVTDHPDAAVPYLGRRHHAIRTWI